jgi:hypothetical protein
MNNQFSYFSLTIAVIAIAAAIRWFVGELNGSSYYKRYPGAKLIDDAAAQGKLPPGGVDALVNQLAEADDINAKVKEIRADVGIAAS